MSGHWYHTAIRRISEITANFPNDMPFKERKRAVQDAYPFGERKYYPYKAWLRAQREYLTKYDDKPAGPLHAAMIESPLDRAKRLSENHDRLMRVCGRIT